MTNFPSGDPLPPRAPRPRARFALLGLVAVLPALLVSAYVVAARPAPSTSPPPPPLPPVEAEARMLDVSPPQPLVTPEPEVSAAPRPVALGLPPPEISAASAVVVDEQSLAVLYDKAAFQRRPPASLTKIATAIVAAEQGLLDEVATSGIHYWTLDDSTTMGLEPGDRVTIRNLLYGLMLVSGNDAAIVIAEHLFGTEEAFVTHMNDLATRLGLTDTHFTNASGLHHQQHYSSAWDMAMLSRYLMRFEELRTIVGTEEIIVAGLREGERVEFDLYNHNPLLNYTEGVDGVKTGFVEQAGRTFSVSVTRGGHRIYIVLMDSTLRAQDSQDLIEWAFANHVWPDGAAAP